MTYRDISRFAIINKTDSARVNELADSMIADGWKGCPILILDGALLTGSHRLAALKEVERRYMADEMDEEPDVLNQEIAEDVSDIVNENIAAKEDELGYAPEIDYSDIGWLLSGSWVEAYKSEIAEW